MTQFRKLSIVIPVFNEKKTISVVLAAIREVELPMEKEIILVDDCSTDGSREILKALTGFKVILLDKNQGKGAAVKRGFGEATGDIILIQDGDLEYDPHDYAALVEPIIEGRADVVYGSRFIESEWHRKNKIIYKRGYLFSKVLNWMSNILSGAWLSDMYTCYKVLSRDSMDKIYPRLTSKRFGIDPELTALASKLNLKIEEVPVSYRGRTYEEGKKINWKDGLAAIWHIVKFNIFTGK